MRSPTRPVPLETTIRPIKSDWQHLQQEAAAVGMTIDAASGTVTYVESSDPEEAAIQEGGCL
jgi:hypothetical protein